MLERLRFFGSSEWHLKMKEDIDLGKTEGLKNLVSEGLMMGGNEAMSCEVSVHTWHRTDGDEAKHTRTNTRGNKIYFRPNACMEVFFEVPSLLIFVMTTNDWCNFVDQFRYTFLLYSRCSHHKCVMGIMWLKKKHQIKVSAESHIHIRLNAGNGERFIH